MGSLCGGAHEINIRHSCPTVSMGGWLEGSWGGWVGVGVGGGGMGGVLVRGGWVCGWDGGVVGVGGCVEW